MAATICKSSDYSSEPLAVLGQPDRGANVHGKTRHFSHFGRYVLDSVANSGGKLPNGARMPTKLQPAPWYFLGSEADFEIISTYILNFRQSPLIIGTALRNVAETLPRQEKSPGQEGKGTLPAPDTPEASQFWGAFPILRKLTGFPRSDAPFLR